MSMDDAYRLARRDFVVELIARLHRQRRRRLLRAGWWLH